MVSLRQASDDAKHVQTAAKSEETKAKNKVAEATGQGVAWQWGGGLGKESDGGGQSGWQAFASGPAKGVPPQIAEN